MRWPSTRSEYLSSVTVCGLPEAAMTGERSALLSVPVRAAVAVARRRRAPSGGSSFSAGPHPASQTPMNMAAVGSARRDVSMAEPPFRRGSDRFLLTPVTQGLDRGRRHDNRFLDVDQGMP